MSGTLYVRCTYFLFLCSPVQRRAQAPRAALTAPRPTPGPSTPLPSPDTRTLAAQVDEVTELDHASAASKHQTNAGYRKAQLLADPRVKAVEPNRIQCNICEKWLKLNEIMSYAPYNWYKHIERCVERNKYVRRSSHREDTHVFLSRSLKEQAIQRTIEVPKQEVFYAPPAPPSATRKTYTS